MCGVCVGGDVCACEGEVHAWPPATPLVWTSCLTFVHALQLTLPPPPPPPPHPHPQVFTDVFSREHQLIRADPRRATYLACGLLLRGVGGSVSDMNRNIARLRPSLRLPHWNCEVHRGGGEERA